MHQWERLQCDVPSQSLAISLQGHASLDLTAVTRSNESTQTISSLHRHFDHASAVACPMRCSVPELGVFAAKTSDFRLPSCDLSRAPIPTHVCHRKKQRLRLIDKAPAKSLVISLPGHPSFDLTDVTATRESTQTNSWLRQPFN